jgi:hypothetical protein
MIAGGTLIALPPASPAATVNPTDALRL